MSANMRRVVEALDTNEVTAAVGDVDITHELADLLGCIDCSDLVHAGIAAERLASFVIAQVPLPSGRVRR